jgi:muconolactone delta-isomerase
MSMKYLVISRRRDGIPVPPDVVAGMLLAQRDWVQEKLDDGTFDCAYTFAQGGGGISIVNAESGEDLHRIATSSPLFGISNVELQPLADVSVLGDAAAALRRVAAVPA